MTTRNAPVPVGVIGVGSMGHQHARVYAEMPGTRLVGVTDADPQRAAEVAEQYGTTATSTEDLLAAARAVTIATPDRFHYELARRALDAGVNVLVEKPFVTDPDDGRDLVARADRAGLVLQVGHVERFNPALQTLADVLVDEDVISIDADRRGPPVDQDVADSPVRDLMIHDIDVVCALLDEDVRSVQASAAGDDPHVTAVLTFESDVTARLTASRITQQKVRELTVTTRDACVTADYLSQGVEIHRQSVPEYVAHDGNVRYRHEGVVERPTVERGEPLRNQLASFVRAVEGEHPPQVTGADGLRALAIAELVEAHATAEAEPPEVSP